MSGEQHQCADPCAVWSHSFVKASHAAHVALIYCSHNLPFIRRTGLDLPWTHFPVGIAGGASSDRMDIRRECTLMSAHDWYGNPTGEDG